MIVALVSNAPACIIHARNDELYIFKDEGPILKECDKFHSNPRIQAVHHKTNKHCNEQMDHDNAVEQSDKILNTNWRENLTLPEENSAYCGKFIDMVTQLDHDGHFWSDSSCAAPNQGLKD